MSLDTEQEWITPDDAVALLEEVQGVAGREVIVDKLFEGKIKCKVSLVWDTPEKHYRKGWEDKRNYRSGGLQNQRLISKHWRSAEDLHADAKKWRWPEGNLFLHRWVDGKMRLYFYENVQFSRKDIVALRGKLKDRGGRRIKYEDWGYLCCALIEIERANRLNSMEFQSKDKFIDAVRLFIQLNLKQKYPLSEDSLQKALTPVYRRFFMTDEARSDPQ